MDTLNKKVLTNTFKWFLPTSIRSKTNYFEVDITKYCQQFFQKEEYFSRKINFDKQYIFSRSTIEKIHPEAVKKFDVIIN